MAYFVNRFELGESLAKRLLSLRGTDAIVLCLKESSMPTCISLASRIRAWIYPLLTEPVIIPGDDRIIGVINQDGTLCYNDGLPEAEQQELEMDYQTVIQESSRVAFSRLNKRLGDFGELNKYAMLGRTVVLVGDIIRDRVEISAAKQLLKPLHIKELISVAGNIDVDSSTSLFAQSNQTNFIDIMNITFDDSHYFDQTESYTPEEQRALAMNISHYWV